MSRPLIGIPGQTLQAIDDIPEALPHSWVMNSRYFMAAAEAGAAPVMIPLFVEDHDILREIYDRLDGVLLAGGVDMHPLTYGEHPHPRLGRTDPARDVIELALAKWAIADRKPILGLCRGAQVLNVALGGTLWQDIETQVPTALKHDYFPTAGYARDYLAHEVHIAPDSRLHAAFNAASVPVNSMHHQAVKQLAPSLHASAHSPDGMVEAIESGSDHFLVGVQWHPEIFEDRDERTRRLFKAFADAAHTRRN
ncbi:MAG TPA: gamma-glutamyl-gamma-aminobutyrate hydrolase family protein [Gemmatimonadales bacterium]|nr:gamma-glutamyl-gamma-aminobutyrate hydrolase family protein [Gemmatimonadales bacterium]